MPVIHCLMLSCPIASIASTVIYAFNTSDLFGKSVVALLIGGSVFAWSVMITKLRHLQRAAADTRRFIAAYRREGHPLALYVQKRVFYGPVFAVYDEVCRALGSELGARRDASDLFASRSSSAIRVRLTAKDLELARSMTDRTIADQTHLLQNDMGFLAVVVTAAPFLGLLGTVWGVMDAFRTMAVHGSVLLSAVAPGISGALLTTVVGLLVALPSLIGYNLLTNQIRRLCTDMENFSEELAFDLDRHFSESR